MTAGDGKQSKTRRILAAVGSALAVPVRLADAVLGVPHSPGASQTVRELERLAALRRNGELSEAEYRRAKDAVLGG